MRTAERHRRGKMKAALPAPWPPAGPLAPAARFRFLRDRLI
jgi:hypothetical protein